MRKKIVVVGSAGNLGKYIYKELNKTDILIGIQRKKNKIILNVKIFQILR